MKQRAERLRKEVGSEGKRRMEKADLTIRVGGGALCGRCRLAVSCECGTKMGEMGVRTWGLAEALSISSIARRANAD